jgi:hypothetical protein
MTCVNNFAQRLAAIQDRISAAALHSGRRPNEVRLMAVSKTQPADALAEAASAGLTLFGENRVQEFETKRACLGQIQLPPIEVHLIGHLQSNKSARAAELFDAVDTLDSLRLAERLNDASAALGRTLPVLIEIKTSAEPTKHGLAPDSPELRTLLERLPDLPHLRLGGLMTIAPLDDNPGAARAAFRRLRTLRDTLAQAHSRLDFSELSMGMSGDFEIAIEEGSTLVRIGTALFGHRPTPQPEPEPAQP